jgi:hypothetical protein
VSNKNLAKAAGSRRRRSAELRAASSPEEVERVVDTCAPAADRAALLDGEVAPQVTQKCSSISRVRVRSGR